MVENLKTLDEIANQYQTDKGSKYEKESVHGYALIYEKYFEGIRNNEIRLLEVGVCMEDTDGGHSIRMWRDYFKNSKIYTFDIVDMTENKVMKEIDNVYFYKGDQSNRKDLQSLYNYFGTEDFDFILEDGSHIHEHQLISLGQLFKYVKPGGIYILEDMSIPNHSVCCIRNDKSYQILNNFIENGIFDTDVLYDEEKKYLKDNIEKIEIFPDIKNAYSVAIIHKKNKKNE